MSRRGKIVDYILTQFESDPHTAMATYQVAHEIYGDKAHPPTKAQRVAVLRAMNRAVELNPELELHLGDGRYGEMVIFRAIDEKSHFAMRNLEKQYWEKEEVWDGEPVWWVEKARAKRAGDTARVEELEAEREARLARMVAAFRGITGTPTPPTKEERLQRLGAMIHEFMNDYPDVTEESWSLDGVELFKLTRL